MDTRKQVFVGLIITVAIFLVSTLPGIRLDLNLDFFPDSFVTHSAMLLLSVYAIYRFRKQVKYKFSLPDFRKLFKPILLGILVAIVVNVAMSAIALSLGEEIESHPLLMEITPLQTIIFIFIYASIAEELLFRGFLLNMLRPIGVKGVHLLKRKISFPVIISAIVFGAAHVILFATDAGALFVLRIVVFTTVLGLVAGYYQEKYDNNAFAIIVHMAGNLMAVIGSVLMSINPG
jgi:membrane protease YdiL (CAAX protease family)